MVSLQRLAVKRGKATLKKVEKTEFQVFSGTSLWSKNQIKTALFEAFGARGEKLGREKKTVGFALFTPEFGGAYWESQIIHAIPVEKEMGLRQKKES